MRDTLVSVLLSPHFCFRVDLPCDGNGGIEPLSDYALASRLSYVLWASMPDRELLSTRSPAISTGRTSWSNRLVACCVMTGFAVTGDGILRQLARLSPV